ncbi:MAG: hypothetical protein J6B83_03270 [Bacteroidaceae bacterium]|nr:hypothetical protein [Bacteroidaceae bacterium]
MTKHIAEILKDQREGLPLWSPAYGNVELKKATDTGVIIRTKCGYFLLNVYGKIYAKGECMLFPSKEQRNWDKFWPYEDGDVLYVKTKADEHVFIYKDKIEENHVCRYVNLNHRGKLLKDPDGYVCYKSNIMTIRYATKEEIEALHTAIEKEGKIWDPVKKELESIETVAAEEKAEKFDINTLKPFDKVLVRDDNTLKWAINLWMSFEPDVELGYQCLRDTYGQCIPYEGNEHLLLTKDMPDEYYITWEEKE